MSELDENWYQLEFGIARSLRYNAKRRAFFEKCNQLSRAIIVFTGAGSAFAAYQAEQSAHGATSSLMYLGIIVAFFAGLDLLFEFPRRAMTYDHLYRCFADLSVEVASDEKTEANYRRLLVKKLLIEKDEPTSLDVLNVVCSNEELQARGFEEGRKIYWWQNLFKQMFSLPPLAFDKTVILTPK